MIKRITLIFLLLLITGATGALAQIDDLAPVPTAPPVDSDGDGLPDNNDACPNQAGPRQNKGCPDSGPNDPQPNPDQNPNDPPRDSDGDGVLDPDDSCPTVPGTADNRGCPPADTDGDGIVDSNDECPTVPGLVERAGCPEPDTDADGMADSADQCPTVPGTADNNGCPPFSPPALPVDGCYVTPATDVNVNVRRTPNLAAPVIGTLLSGVVYEAEGYIIRNGTDIWFVLKNYPMNAGVLPGTIGFASRTALLASACPEIVVNPTTGAADDLTSSADGPGVLDPQAMQCAAKPGTTLVEACWCETSDSECVDQLVSICYGGSSYIEEGPDTTACWFEDDEDDTSIDDLIQTADDGPGVVQPMQCATQQGTTLLEACWCETSDSFCVDQLVSICYGGNNYIEAGPDTTACWFDENDDAASIRGDNDPIKALLEAEPASRMSYCEDDLSVWWIVPPFGGSQTFGLMTPTNCNPDPLANSSVLDGWKFFMDGLCGEGNYLVSWLEDENGDIIPSTVQGECDQASAQSVGGNANELSIGDDNSTADKEWPNWWNQAMPLICGGKGWILVLETDEDGDEVVTDAACTDD